MLKTLSSRTCTESGVVRGRCGRPRSMPHMKPSGIEIAAAFTVSRGVTQSNPDQV